MSKNFITSIEKDLSHLDDIVDIVFKAIVSSPRTNATTLFLEGQLGAGKTTFTQALGKKLGIKLPMTSPTYTIMNEYEVEHPEFKKVIHMDLYRIETLWELQEYNLEKWLQDSHTLFLIEWSKSSQQFFEKTHRFQIDISQSSQTTRTYTLSKFEKQS
jgi:tRNA threonylcarbamoyladenosine biosynthesis protein TsaE